MTRPIPYWALSLLFVLMSVLCLLFGLRALAMPSWPRAVDQPSYAAGWSYVVNRQPGGHGAASLGLRTDDGIRGACRVYADGFAQLDGVRDADDFLAGCDDAAESTRLEPTVEP